MMLTARDIVMAARKGREISIPACLWREFKDECVARCGDCSDLYADVDMRNQAVVIRKPRRQRIR